MEKRLLLNNWTFKSPNESWLPAKVPGCIHLDLLNHSIIEDPFYGTNEKQLQWIDKRDWDYETRFDVKEEVFNLSNLELQFAGLDTYTDVYLNNKRILSTDNMFRIWTVDVKKYIKLTDNLLSVHFRSPINEDLPKLKKLGYQLPATNDDSKLGELGDQKISIFARKAPYHYGWDWGPRFVTSGIWRDVHLRGWSEARITDLFIEQTSVTTERAQVKAMIEVETDCDMEAIIKIAAEELQFEKKVALTSGVNSVGLELEIESPKLWWCQGLGDPSMYTFKAELLIENEVLSSRAVKTGLRQAKLVRKKDEKGTTFYLELNGVPVFIKGANHIPNDSFVTTVSYDRYEHEVQTAVKSNINMLRVWGGGIYENDEFYELCNEYGLLVWQDFMFACSMYPGDEAFIENVKIEAEQNVKRLRNHPSIVLWCGNNEMDAAWSHYNENAGWGWKEQFPTEVRNEIWADYERIFHEVLPNVVEELSPNIDYWPSSPMCGITNDSNQHSFYESTSGDIHYWGVWHGEEPLENFNKYVGRFMSEYGFQSFPEPKTVLTYAEEEDMLLESEVMLHHQKNNRGNQLINEYMKKYYKEPKDFRSFLYMSQVLQAEAMKIAIESHRRHKPFCMGTIYWQLNDCWPVASWASMDYYGRWKAAQYIVKRSYQDIMVSCVENEKNVDIYVVSDKLDSFDGQLKVRLMTLDGEVLHDEVMDVSIDANSSKVVLSLDRNKLLKDYRTNNVLLSVQLMSAGMLVDDKQHYFTTTKELELKCPTISVKKLDNNQFVLETDVLAKQVQLQTDDEGVFSDNYFDLVPGELKLVCFDKRISSDLKVSSMYDYVKEE